MNPDNAKALYRKGLSLSMLGRHEEAIPCLEQALAINSDIADAWVVLSNSCFMLGRLEESARAFDQAYYIDVKDVRTGIVKGLYAVKSPEKLTMPSAVFLRFWDPSPVTSLQFPVLVRSAFPFYAILTIRNVWMLRNMSAEISEGVEEDKIQKNLADHILGIKNVNRPTQPRLPGRSSKR